MRKTAALLVALLSVGCATFERGPMQRVVVESDPAGAYIDARGCALREEERRTPATLMIPRRVKRCTLTLSLDGYVPARVFLERRHAERVDTEVAIFGTLCGDSLENCDSLTDLFVVGAVGGLLYGLSRGVDAAAGSNYELQPNYVSVTLEPDAPPSASNEDPQLP
jgi:hypothetical protein